MIQGKLKDAPGETSIRFVILYVLTVACASAALIFADALRPPSFWLVAAEVICLLGVLASLGLLWVSLSKGGDARISGVREVVQAAPQVLVRAAVTLAGLVGAILLYGILAFILDLTLFPLTGTQTALVLLEGGAALGALALSPVPLMLFAGSAFGHQDGFHPLREIRAVRGAYLPLMALSLAASAVGALTRLLSSFIPSDALALIAFAVLSVTLGTAWLMASMAITRKTSAEGGSSQWWRSWLHTVWNRRIRRGALAATSCLLAFALGFSLLGVAPLAYAAETLDPSAPHPVEPDIYTPPEGEGSSAEGSSSSADASTSADEPSTSGDLGKPTEPDSSSDQDTPDIPALPPEEYYEQPQLEGDPVAIEGEATLVKLSERSYTTVIGGADIAYEDHAGNIRPIDNTLEAISSAPFEEPDAFRNKRNAFTAELPAKADEEKDAGLTLWKDGKSVSLIPEGVDFSRAWAEGEAIRYTEARPGIDWQYTLVGSVIKEDIVLIRPVEEQAFDTHLVLSDDLQATLEEGVCTITDADGVEVMGIAAPIATDAAGEVSDNLTLGLEEREGKLTLTLTPDWEWLASENRAYPVRIDPTVDIASSSVRLGCVEQQWRNVHVGENGYAYAGYDDGVKTGTGIYNHGVGHAICRAYAEINYDFSYIMSEARIDSATFSLYQHRAYSGGATNFGLYRVVEPWSFDGLTWAKQEGLTHELVCFRQANTSPGYIDWDVRECVNNWIQGVYPQRGFCVKAEYERGMQCEMFQNRYAANPPALTINWTIPDPVDEGRPLDATTVKVRTLTEHDADNKLQLDGVFADGEATPRATVAYTLDPTGETGISYASRSYKYPDSTEWQASIPNATRYKDKLSNWQSHVFASLAYDTLYKVRALAVKDGVSGKEAVSDTFLVYKATSKDTLPYIASHYGTTLDQLARDNRVQDCLVVGGNTIFVRNPKTNTPYNPGDLTEDQKRRIDSGLMGRGKHCEYGFEPVNMNTGNFVLEGIDASAPDAEGAFEVRRTYNSKDANTSGALGRGWALSFTDRISAEASGTLVYTASDGASYYFDPDGEGGYTLDGDQGFELDRIAYRPDGAKETDPDLFRYEVRTRDHTLYAFDCYGMLTSVASSSGLTTQITYDANHLMESVISPAGRVFRFAHDGFGRVSEVLLPDGNTVAYGYDARGDLVTVKEAGRGEIRYVYDTQGRMTEWYDPTGAPMVRNTYDDQGRVTYQYDANGSRSALSYAEGATTATDAEGHITTYRFDDAYRTTGITYPDGTSIRRAYDGGGNLIADENGTYSYDGAGNRVSATDLRGLTTTYAHDEAGRVTRVTYPDGEAVTYERDARGNVVCETSSTGRAFMRTFDELCRKTSETDADGVTTTFAYVGADLVFETDALGNTTTYGHDGMGRVTSETDPEGNTSYTSYDAMGRVVAETDGSGAATRYALDARGLLLALTDANGNTTAFSYDGAANMTSMTTPSGGVWTYGYDGVGNLTLETDPSGHTTAYGYDGRGRKVSETDAAGAAEAWSYDGRGRITSHTLESGATETFAYEGALDVPSSENDGLGNITRRTFDARGKVASVTYPDGGVELISYTAEELTSHTSPTGLVTTIGRSAAGRVQTLDQSGRTWSLAYDEAGRPSSVTDPLGNASLIESDAAGRQVALTDAEGNITRLAYDGEGRITAVTDALGNVTSVTYDGLGNITSETDALGNVTAYAYGWDGQLTSVTDALGNVRTYAYDVAGNLTSETDERGAVTRYSYDETNRLALMTDPLGRETAYGYDAHGNLTRITLPDGNSERLGYDALGNVVSATDASGRTVSLEVDWRGNPVSATGEGLGSETYAYDKEGRLTSFTDAAGRSASTVYDLWGSAVLDVSVQGQMTATTYDELGRVVSETDATGATTRYGYDGRGNLTSLIDPFGAATRYGDDAAGRMIQVVDALGSVTSFEVDAAGNALTETDPDGYVSRFSYDALGRQIASVNGRGDAMSVVYDGAGNITSVTDGEGNTEAYAYDLAGQLISRTDALGNAENLSYDVRGNAVAYEEAGGATSTFAYDKCGNLVAKTDPLGATTRYEVDALGLATQVVEANGAVYQYAYDGAGRMTRAQSPLGYVRSFTYGAADLPLTETDSLGLSISYELDALGRITQATAAGAAETFAYDKRGNLTSHTDRTGATESFAYDALSRLIGYRDGSGTEEAYGYDRRGNVTSVTAGSSRTSYAYDGASNLTSVSRGSKVAARYSYDHAGRAVSAEDGAGNKTTYAYDAVGNLTKETDSTGAVWRYDYDAQGNVVSSTSPANAQQRWVYDAAGRLAETQDADGAKTVYGRDVLGNVTSVTDALGRVSTYAYDAEGNLTQTTDPSGSMESMVYDLKGRLASLTSPSGACARYDYDALDNLLSKSYTAAEGRDVSYAYDGEGNKTGRSDKTGDAAFTYDGAGRLASETDGFGQTLAYSYDDAGRLSSITYPEGEVATYSYDEAGNLSSVSAPEGTYAYTYDEVNQPVALTRPDGSVTHTTYDGEGRITSVESADPEGQTLSSFTYSYDPEGRIASEASSVTGEDGAARSASRVFTYTPAGKLASVEATEDGAAYTERYAYDGAGNRTHLVREGTDADEVTYTYDASDRLISEESATHGTTNYTYDADGQLISKASPEESFTYAYGVEGRLEAVMAGDLLLMAAVYDGDGNKAGSSTLYHTTRTLPDGPVAQGAAELLGALIGGDEGDRQVMAGGISVALHAMAAMTGGLSACIDPALLPEAIPVACRLARDIFGRGASYVPEELPNLLLHLREGKATEALTKALLPKASLTATDEAYDITSYVNSSLFEVSEVMGSSSSRDGRTSVFYGLERLSQVREGTTEAFIHDGRGSVAQTILGGAVTSWKRYGAFGAVTAGTDAREKPFFGYDAEEQDPLTGLTYLRARYYDPTSARFGVADTYLGNTFDPLTLNRYLYCASDPVNHVDPTGHYIQVMTALSSIQLNKVRYPNHPNWYKKTGGTRINNDSFANLPGQITTKSTLISPNAPAATKRAQAIYNTNTALGIAAMRAGDYDLAKTYMEAAAATIDEYLRVYCGADRAHLDDIHNVTGSLSLPLTLVPILGSYNDYLYHATEGNGPMAALFALFFVADAVTLGGVTLAKLGITGGKVVAGAGMKEAAKEVASTTAKTTLKGVDSVDPNKLHHIFDDPKHKLGDFLSKFDGDKEKAYRAIEDELIKHINKTEIYTTTEWTRITVNGEEFDATWRTINGEVLLVDASRRDVL